MGAAGVAAHHAGERVHQDDHGQDDAALLEQRPRDGDQHHQHHQQRQLHACRPKCMLGEALRILLPQWCRCQWHDSTPSITSCSEVAALRM